jgi:predicted DCC family thiol-disulfide oxidoreductase YuxK
MIPIAMAPRSYSWTLLYDDECGLCRWCLGLVLRLDRRREVNPVAVRTDKADSLLADLLPEERQASWHLVSPDGRRWSAGAAAPPLLRLMPGGRSPAALLEAAMPITQRAYRLIAEHRNKLGPLIPQASKARANEVIGSRVAEITVEQRENGAVLRRP